MSDDDPKQDGTARKWLKLLSDAEASDRFYQDKCDSIDRLYSDLKSLSGERVDREFQMFWANLGVLRPTIYSRPPVPVATPRFRDRKPLPRTAADILERALVSDFDADDIHDTLKLARDDLAIAARGVVWLRIGDRDGIDVPLCEHLSRKDFRHEPARKWKEVGWVARRAWLTRREMRDRFGDAASQPGITFEERKLGADDQAYEGEKKAEVWEIWHKGENLVAWVAPGAADVLDEREPWMKLTGFFPCPRPAYATLQRETLIPVPDVVYYRDQLEEINELTARISALSEALRLRGFYPAGNGEISEAIESAIRTTDDRAILVPISSFAQLGGAAPKDAIVWLPVRDVAEVIRQLVELRRQLIEDVYEITGLSDIMRGATQASETATAQQLKSQYGAIRVRERQEEMVRLARDVTRLKAEIMAENVALPDLLTMAQVDDIPTAQDVQMHAQQVMAQAMQQGPEAAQQAQQQLRKMHAETVTQEQIEQLLRDQKTRPFVLDIETDSTIQPDENAEKQRRVEFMGAVGGFIQQAAPLVMQAPMLAPFAGEAMQFLAGGFRAGRSMDMAIDELVEQMRAMGKQPQRPNPQQVAEAERVKAETERENALAQADIQLKQAQAAKTMREAQAPDAEPVSIDPMDRARLQLDAEKIRQAGQKLALDAASKAADIKLAERAQDKQENGDA